MELSGPAARAADAKPPRARLPLLHRASDGDERAFRLRPWSGEFEDEVLEARFDKRQAPELHERTWRLSIAVGVVVAVLGLAEVLAGTTVGGRVGSLIVHIAIAAPLLARAGTGRARRDQLNQLPFDFDATAKLEAWLFAGLIAHLILRSEPVTLDLTTFCITVLLSHLVVPNRWRLLTPITGVATVLYLITGLTVTGSMGRDSIATVTVLSAVWIGGAYFHREIEIARRVEFMTVERAARYRERLEAAVRRSQDLEAELRRQANIDPLTAIGNRRWFFEQLDLEFARARRTRRPVAVLILDVDHFKLINDHHGHPVGDQVLKHLAALVRRTLRTGDLLARIGGEEFAVLMPETHQRDAHDIAERVRAAVAANPVLISTGAIRLTVSVGLTTCRVDVEEATQALARADNALYDAKRGGRDLVIAR